MNRILGLVFLAGASLTLQGQQQAPVFRASTDVVPLTVTVVDRKGAPVTDLRQSDFTVFENKRPREILNFFTQTFTPHATAPEGPLNRAAPQIAPATRRVFLVLLGYGRIQYPTKAIDGVQAFIKDHLLPQDLLAVMAFNRSTDFTGDREQLSRMLERYRREHERICLEIDEFRKRHLPGEPLPQWIHDDIEAVFTGIPTARIRNTTPPWKTDGQPDGAARSVATMLMGGGSLQTAEAAPGRRIARSSGRDLADAVIASSGMKLTAAIRYMRHLEGEKRVLYLGQEPISGNAVARALNDAQITLDIARTHGPQPRGGMGQLVAIQAMQRLVEQNGGSFTGNMYADRALAQVDATSRFSYLLGYAPVDPTRDRQYREVEVKVNRPDVIVRYRHGYYAVDEPDPVQLREVLTEERLTAAASYDRPSSDIKLDVQATPLPRMGVSHGVRVNVRIDTSRLAFTPGDGGARARLHLRIHVGDAKELVVGELSDELVVTSDVPDAAAQSRPPVTYTARLDLSGAAKYVKVVVYDAGADLLGSTTVTLPSVR